MAVIDEIIRFENNQDLSFGNYIAEDKQKLDGFEVGGDIYKVKTHKEITRLEKNCKLLYESVPGSTVHKFKFAEKIIKFCIEGFENTKITMELEPEKEYKILIDSVNVGSMKSNFSGKINFSIELNSTPQEVRIEKV